MDPYCKITIGNQTKKTNTHMNGAKNPQWNENLYFFVNNDDMIQIEIFESKALSKEDIIGETSI